MSDTTGKQRLADLWEQLRNVRAGPKEAYKTDDVLAVLYLLRHYSIAEIERRTGIQRGTITRWRDSFNNRTLEHRYPDIYDRATMFDPSVLGEPPHKRQERPLLAWQQTVPRLEDRRNPYLDDDETR